MAFTLSPSVAVTERDFSGIVSLVATTPAAFVGRFDQGPVNERVLISSVKQLQEIFGEPSVQRYGTDWWTCYNFLQYGNNLTVVRAAGTGSTGATAGFSADYGADEHFVFRAKEEGAFVNGALEVQIVTAGMTYAAGTATDAFSFNPNTSSYAARFGASNDELSIAVIDRKGVYGPSGAVLELYEGMSQIVNAVDNVGDSLYYKYVLANSNYIKIDDSITGFQSIMGSSGGQDPTLYGAMGYTTGVDITISSADLDGSGNLPAAISDFGKKPFFIFGAPAGNSGGNAPFSVTLQGGAYGNAVTSANKRVAWTDYFSDTDEVDVSILIAGDADNALNQHVIDLAITRKDCIAVISQPVGSGFADTSSLINQSTLSDVTYSTLQTYKTTLSRDTSYAVMDGNWKYQNDSYNGVTRWVPLNGDIAGLLARTETDYGAWFSPAGYTRGGILNVVKLAFNPTKAQRDGLYSLGINNVFAFPGQGTLLFGDKTLQSKPSAFDKIQVRRLFNVLEKSLATSANFVLFEQNDSFTRQSFVSQVEPVLRDVQNRRGIENYRIVCDETNNTSAVIDRGEFVADIYIQPTKSVQFVKLNFVANNSGSFFTEG